MFPSHPIEEAAVEGSGGSGGIILGLLRKRGPPHTLPFNSFFYSFENRIYKLSKELSRRRQNLSSMFKIRKEKKNVESCTSISHVGQIETSRDKYLELCRAFCQVRKGRAPFCQHRLLCTTIDK